MYTDTGLRILNGRCTGDVTGNFTCHNYRGSSIVDYCSKSESLLTKIIFFTVHTFLPEYSDHRQISAMLQVNCSMAENIDNVPNVIDGMKTRHTCFEKLYLRLSFNLRLI